MSSLNILNPAQTASFEEIRGWLGKRCGIHYPDAKRDLLLQRLARVQMAHRLPDLSDMANRVVRQDSSELQQAVMHAASTNHTYFFREQEVLTQVDSMILPTLATRPEIRIWSAAASTGDEAYTLAIMIAEKFGMSALPRLQILGTDISKPVIERAEQGIYAQRQMEQIPADIRRKYFDPVGLSQFQVKREIRNACTFRWMNLKAQPYPFSKMFQIVFCRNILYYFEKADQVATLDAIYAVTEPGGWLVTSVTESIRDLSAKWQFVSSGIARKGGQ